MAADGPLPSGYEVTSGDLEVAQRRQGVELESGDALVVRGGWTSTPDATRHEPGRRSVDAATRGWAPPRIHGLTGTPVNPLAIFWILTDAPRPLSH
ncbi:hypothetical protein [Actinomadura opuntiae]|uniref:hypothetical protein n=1 Tax=Actinomadura sp. OS1-43 TaxID=604315 RepID=UPI00334101D5